jgi:GTP cyclohydrolase IA
VPKAKEGRTNIFLRLNRGSGFAARIGWDEASVAREHKNNSNKTKVARQPLSSRKLTNGTAIARSNGDDAFDFDPGPTHNADFEAIVRRELELVGENPDREGLLKTPRRVANALCWLTRGYRQDVAEVVGDALFEESHESMVMVRDIELYSMCEHHMLPFFGRAHVAYIPNGRIVGLSKLPRLVEVFARRLQVQERLTEEIAQAIEDVLKPRGVGVVLECAHLCMMMRGVEKQNSKTITSALRGVFRDDARTREEFLSLAHAGRQG